MNKYSKTKRQQVLREVIAGPGPGDQHHLLRELKRQGIATTQATISRDLHEMGFIRIRVESGVYRYEYFEKESDESLWRRLQVLFLNFVIDIKGVNNLILLKTSPGNANGVASLIDALQRKEILGTVAGDDTILVVISGVERRKTVEKELKKLLGKVPKR
jgi:transcriptional regulator of arginine metabolism